MTFPAPYLIDTPTSLPEAIPGADRTEHLDPERSTLVGHEDCDSGMKTSAIHPDPKANPWAPAVHGTLRSHNVGTVGYVPDGGLRDLLELCRADPLMRAVPLTTEEEGIGMAMGAWLGGEKTVLLLQSSGVGKLVNALGAVRECGFPLVMLATMRGEEGELNPWQVPMGRAVATVLQAMGLLVSRVEEPRDVGPSVDAALRLAYEQDAAVAVLLSQKMLGIKSFQERIDS